MNEMMRRATAVAIPFGVGGALLLFDMVRPGMGVVSLILAIALFAAGGVNDRYRLLWVPFAAVGVFLAALNFTAFSVSREPVGLLFCMVSLVALLIAAGDDWRRSVSRRTRP